MTGENFKRFHATKRNPLREKLERLERKRSKLWDDFCDWCSENPNGGTPPIDYEYELKTVSFEIENVKYLMGV
jgi:hypothetical protein